MDSVTKVDNEIAAQHLHDDMIADQSAPVNDRGRRARAGAAAQRLTNTSLPHAHCERVTPAHRDELHVRALREPWIVLEMRSVLRDARGNRIVDEQHEMRITHS